MNGTNTETIMRAKITESKDEKGLLWECCVIGEGIGKNVRKFGDKTYRENFTRKSIEGLIPLLEGVKVKAYKFFDKYNHLPVSIDEEFRGKIVSQNVGILEDSRGREINGKLHAYANVRIMEGAEWLGQMLKWAHDNNHPDYLGLSINSDGEFRLRVLEADENYMDIEKIDRPYAVEVVDEPAAKGEVSHQFIRVIESVQNSLNEKKIADTHEDQSSWKEEKINELKPYIAKFLESSNIVYNTEATPMDMLSSIDLSSVDIFEKTIIEPMASTTSNL